MTADMRPEQIEWLIERIRAFIEPSLGGDGGSTALQNMYVDRIQAGNVADVIVDALQGLSQADAALRRVAGELESIGEPLPEELRAYIAIVVQRGLVSLPKTRGPDPAKKFDRDLAIAVAVRMCECCGLDPHARGHNASAERPSGSWIVAEALGRLNARISEAAVEKIWAAKSDFLAAWLGE